MRLAVLALLFSLCAARVAAQTQADSATPRPHLTTEQRFELANTTGDGRLTIEQARLGYRSVARHFSAIDLTGRGYVTLDDVLAWQRANHDARRTARLLAEDPLRPRPAIQRGTVRAVGTGCEPVTHTESTEE